VAIKIVKEIALPFPQSLQLAVGGQLQTRSKFNFYPLSEMRGALFDTIEHFFLQR
jgi:hypothetical protein